MKPKKDLSYVNVPAEIRTAKFPKNKPESLLREETLSEVQQ
jgi:hypothetical protein